MPVWASQRPQRACRDGRRALPDKPKRHSVCIRVLPSWPLQAESARWPGNANVPGYWSFHLPRPRIRPLATLAPASSGDRDPRCAMPCWQTGCRGGNRQAVLPRSDGILMQPAPHRAFTQCRHQTGPANLPGQIGRAPARQLRTAATGKFTGESLDLNDQLWGEKLGDAPSAGPLPAPAAAFQKSAFARGRRPPGDCRVVEQWHHCSIPPQPTKSSWLGGLENTVTYISALAPTAHGIPLETKRSDTDFDVASRSLHTSKMPQTNLSKQRFNTLVYL